MEMKQYQSQRQSITLSFTETNQSTFAKVMIKNQRTWNMTQKCNVNVNVEFKVTLHEHVRYRGTMQR